MNKNFKVGQSNELIREGRVYDLHNCFDFGCLAISGTGRISIMFRPNTSCRDTNVSITVQAESVDFLELSPKFGVLPVILLDELGYKSRGDDDDEWLVTESQSTAADDLFFRFNDGQYIRFHSEEVLLIETPSVPDSDHQPACHQTDEGLVGAKRTRQT